MSWEKSLKAACRQPLGRGGFFQCGGFPGWLLCESTLSTIHIHSNQQIPILKIRGHQKLMRKMHVTTIFSQTWKNPHNLSCFSFCLFQESRTKEKRKKKTFNIMLLKKSLYFKKLLVLGNRNEFLTWLYPKHSNEVKQNFQKGYAQ